MADIHAVLVSLSETTSGDAFDTAAAIGATTLSLYDVSDFDEDGGSVTINGTVYAYTSADMEADSLRLATGLTAAAAVNDVVSVWDPDSAVVVSEYTALVTVDGQEDGDPLTVDVDHSLSTLLSTGTFSAGQSVTIASDGDGYVLTKVHGKNNQATQRSDVNGISYGLDQGNGTVAGLVVPPAGAHVRVDTTGDVRIKTVGGAAFAPILASAFTVSSDSKVKTEPTEPPDALAIIATAPSRHWRYLTDGDAAQRVGPMADDLPKWMQHFVEEQNPSDSHFAVDVVQMVGVLWRAVEQLTDRIEQLEKGD